ncbi:uncharacterized protein LOC128708823 [Anopheles marshallii]|uniref:uncharacterized protein LOC128708823 n=1 Tax=Anopheles marshallii TaxID=1521116 RepID=UPI00237AB47A|nr:uncharacterized protein LOC128708823 [Anopheles marshallii]
MEEVQHHQAIQPSFFPTNKALADSTETSSSEGTPKLANEGGSFGQDSGYNSYQANTAYSTFNLSSRHGTSVTYATIDEGNENDCSLNDSSADGPGSEINLTPKTAASMVKLSNIHLTTPKAANRSKPTRRPNAFDYDGSAGTTDVDNLSLFLALSTPERLPSRPSNVLSQDTPLRTGNRSANQPIQLTPHKAKGSSQSLKRKHSSFRGKLYSDGDVPLGDENRPGGLNDSFDVDCRRLEDISPILNNKRRKHHDRGIEDLMRSSTPKTVSSQPTFLQLDATEIRPDVKKTLRKFQSFSPSKVQSYAGPFLRLRQPFHGLERTPEKKKELRVLTEIDFQPSEKSTVPPLNLDALLEAPILDDPTKQLEQTVSTVPSFDDFSLTPSKASPTDPEVGPRSGIDGSFGAEDYVLRHAPSYLYAPTLNSIREESPVRAQFIPEKHPVPKTPPSVSKSGRKLKRLGTNETVSSFSCGPSPARSVRSLTRQSVRASVSPKAHRFQGVQNRGLKTIKTFNYCGFEYVNILKQLWKRNSDALEMVLDYLDDTDLVRVVRVSHRWRFIIKNHKKSWHRLKQHLKQQQQNKENSCICHKNGELNQSEIKEPSEPNEKNDGDSEVTKRMPFDILNVRSSGNVSSSQLSHRCSSNATDDSSIVNVTHSPPVSPSMRKFVINQKIASHLKQSEQLRPCPRCGYPSRIIFSRASQSARNKSTSSDHVHSTAETTGTLAGEAHNNNEYSEKSPDCVRKNLFNSSTPSVADMSFNHSPWQLNSSESNRFGKPHMKLRSAATKSLDYPSVTFGSENHRPNTRDSKCDYAVCSGKFCGFKYCIKCLSEYHPNTACADLSVNSPTKEEERGLANVACTRQSRRSLLRLCRK